MSDTPTPGQLAYVTYTTALRPSVARDAVALYAHLSQDEQRAWEAAAQAVLAQYTPPQEPPRRWTPQPPHATGEETP